MTVARWLGFKTFIWTPPVWQGSFVRQLAGRGFIFGLVTESVSVGHDGTRWLTPHFTLGLRVQNVFQV